jgi:hypothetical protein
MIVFYILIKHMLYIRYISQKLKKLKNFQRLFLLVYTVTKFQETIRHGVPLVVGGSISLTKQITDLHVDLDLSISQDSK